MTIKNLLLSLFSTVLLIQAPIANAHLQKSDASTLCEEGKTDCTFVLLSEQNNKLLTINKARANMQLSPFSTFKIPNSIIALESRLIKNTEQALSFDKTKYPPQAWWPSVWKLESYNLSTAFKFSMVAIYRQLATEIGEKEMKQHLAKFNYGNQDISSGLDSFWLNGSIKISANEQVAFLQKLYHNKLGLSVNSSKAMKEVMLFKDGGDYKIYAKTGAGKVDDKSMLGWFVGYVENGNGVHYFAFNFNRATYGAMKKQRTQIVLNHLKTAGIIH